MSISKSIHKAICCFIRVDGKKKYLYSFFYGVTLMFAMPPFFIFPCLLVFSLLYLQIDIAKDKKDAFLIGWFFGFGYFVTGLYWVSSSLLVDPWRFAWLIPFAVSLIPAISSIFVGLAAIVTFMIPEKGWPKIVLFSVLWVAFEMLRGILTQFPWSFIGYSWVFSDNISQIAYIFNVYGLGVLAVLFGTIPASLIYISKEHNVITFLNDRRPIYLVLLLVICSFCYGLYHIDDSYLQNEDKIKVKVVQGNIEQLARTSREERLDNFLRHIDLTTTGEKDSDIIVWPESAVPFVLDEEDEIKKLISNTIPAKSILITGGVRRAGTYGEDDFKYWNSMNFVNDQGEIFKYYNKSILVPFGEFVPFKRVLSFIDKITEGLADFSTGDGVKIIKTLGDRVSVIPIICYEAVFPEYLMKLKGKVERGLIVNVTNDAWFGSTIGPYQHFYMSKVRAIELASPMVRASNTGISGVFDKYGRELKRIELNERGIIDVEISY